ncbi:MAG TPA: hypothetical protein V6C97_18505 [Oculatellaceae cyanobacterium]
MCYTEAAAGGAAVGGAGGRVVWMITTAGAGCGIAYTTYAQLDWIGKNSLSKFAGNRK